MSAKRAAQFGLLTALGLALSYLESLVPLSIAVPGVKFGLANTVTLFALYRLGWKDACGVSFLRVLLAAAMFGSPFSFIYSFAGAAVSLCIMMALKKVGEFTPIGVSVSGGVGHNIGQIAVAAIVMENGKIALYLPVLAVSGVIAGIFTGLLAALLLKRVGTK